MIIFCLMSVFSRKQAQKKRILIIMWTRWPILYMSVSLFLQPAVLFPLPSELWTTIGKKLCMRSQHGFPLTKANLAAAAAECTTSQQQRPTLNFCYGTIPRGRSWDGEPASCLVEHWFNWTTSIIGVTALCSQWNRYLTQIGISLCRRQCTQAHFFQLPSALFQLLQSLGQRPVQVCGKRCQLLLQVTQSIRVPGKRQMWISNPGFGR